MVGIRLDTGFGSNAVTQEKVVLPNLVLSTTKTCCMFSIQKRDSRYSRYSRDSRYSKDSRDSRENRLYDLPCILSNMIFRRFESIKDTSSIEGRTPGSCAQHFVMIVHQSFLSSFSIQTGVSFWIISLIINCKKKRRRELTTIGGRCPSDTMREIWNKLSPLKGSYTNMSRSKIINEK